MNPCMKILFTTLLLFICLSLSAQDQLLIPFESNWKYLDNGSDLGNAWRKDSYNDSSWKTGQAVLGYGEGNENTIVSFGPDADHKYVTTYFRHHFTINDIDSIKQFLLRIKKDDGAIVYINSHEIMRSNFGTSSYNYDSFAYSTISGEEEDIIWEKLLDTRFFETGENVIAVEVHQITAGSSDLIFDLELKGFDDEPEIYRTPYLQKSTTDGITIKWVTDIPTDSKVWYGQSLDDLSNTETSSSLSTNHEIEISGLASDTDYYYKVGTSERELTSANPEYYFTTNPVIGTEQATRIWITGDAGTGKDEQFNVRDSYLNYIGTHGKSDLWLMMGDNAYEHGREADYHMGLFTVYPEILSNTVSFPTTGNHDLLAEANARNETGTFYDIFALPTEGECGGVPSAKESYYSVDYGNVHIICLESTDLDRDSTGDMGTWLKNDLMNTQADWLIAYWHFAPYTKVGHNSDDPSDWSGRAIDMRENMNPILEQYGVDLVLAGHSHGYERSYLIDGHYGLSNTLTSDMILDNTSGNMNETGAYHKPASLTTHNGTVYLVCGNSGKLSSLDTDGPLPGEHPVMYETNTDFAGSVIIDIANGVLEGKFLNEAGIIQDYFHIKKEGTISTKPVVASSVFELYPNPVADLLQVHLKSKAINHSSELTFYSSDGKLVKRVSLKTLNTNTDKMTVDLSDLSSGIYTVKLHSKEAHIQSSLLVKK